jgi:hypothetical protein
VIMANIMGSVTSTSLAINAILVGNRLFLFNLHRACPRSPHIAFHYRNPKLTYVR